MSVDTKGCIVTDVKDVLLVCGIVERSLNKLIAAARREAFPLKRGMQLHSAEVTKAFREAEMHLVSGAAFVRFDFVYRCERRSLSFFFDCDCDHLDLAAKSLSFSMGSWGSSELIGKTVLHALSMLGPVYFERTDSSGEGMVPLDAAPITVFEALAIGYVTPHRLEEIVEKFTCGELPVAKSFAKFVGVSRKKYASMAAVPDHSARWAAFDKAASETYPTPGLLPYGGCSALALA